MAKQVVPTYLDRLLADLDMIDQAYHDVLADSSVRDRNLPSYVITGQTWAWAESDAALERARMDLLRQVRTWEPRFRLLFPHPTPTVGDRLDEHIELFRATVDDRR